MLMKKFFIIFFAILFLTACGGAEIETVREIENEIEEEDENSLDAENEIENEIVQEISSARIAIITDERQISRDAFHNAENIILYTWGDWREREENIATIFNLIADNGDIEVLIISPDILGVNTNDYVRILRERRDDIFIFYGGFGYAHFPFENIYPADTFSDAVSNANLILEVNIYEIARNFPARAQEMGAETLIYFYLGSDWCSETRDYVPTEESYLHRMLRELCEEIGLRFVEIDTNHEIQCGSSYGSYMSETIPPLLEEYGNNIVLLGLCNERIFWSWRDFIYMPIYSQWFEPSPWDIAYNMFFPVETNDNALLIEDIRNALDERNTRGRLASWPMSMQFLFPLAAAEYGLLWANGEVPHEGIDMPVLRQIMVNILAEHTGIEQHGISLSTLTIDGETFENYILVLPDYLIY
jgi:hypothetical protein